MLEDVLGVVNQVKMKKIKILTLDLDLSNLQPIIKRLMVVPWVAII
jgi:hypothetical protein